MLERKVIEFVCTANIGRSPVAELIASWYLEKTGLDEKFEAASSGSRSDAIKGGAVNIDTMLRIVAIGVERGNEIYDGADQIVYEEAKRNLEDPDTGKRDLAESTIIALYERAEAIFHEEELHNRALGVDRLRSEHGVEGYLKAFSEQTVRNHDRIAVLSMAPSNNDVVKQIYRGMRQTQGRPKVIGVLSQFVYDDRKAELPDAFGQGQTVYNEAVDALVEEVPKAIDKIDRLAA